MRHRWQDVVVGMHWRHGQEGLPQRRPRFTLRFLSPPNKKVLQRLMVCCDLYLHSTHSRRSTTFLVVLAYGRNTSDGTAGRFSAVQAHYCSPAPAFIWNERWSFCDVSPHDTCIARIHTHDHAHTH